MENNFNIENIYERIFEYAKTNNLGVYYRAAQIAQLKKKLELGF